MGLTGSAILTFNYSFENQLQKIYKEDEVLELSKL